MAKYHRWVDRMQAIERTIRPSSVYLLLLVIVAFTLGGLSYNMWSHYSQPAPEDNTKQLEKLAKELNSQAQALAARNLELVLADEAQDKMQQMFAQQHQKQAELERELSFYRSIMAPENNADGVAIHGVELSSSLLPNQYRAKIILTQLQKRKQSLKGKAQLTLVGVQSGEIVELDLAKLSGSKLNFKFRYFQVLEAEFILPQDFELSRIKAKVTVPSSRWTKGSQTEIEYSAAELFATGVVQEEPEIVAEPLDEASLLAPQDDANKQQQPIQNQKERILLEQNGQVSDNPAQQTDVRGSND